jgi:hypothetical protein
MSLSLDPVVPPTFGTVPPPPRPCETLLERACEWLSAGEAVVVPNASPMTYGVVAISARTVNAVPCRGERYVHAGKVVTSAGVSAGIDLALWLVGEIAGREQAETIQLYLEYDPHPPFTAGHPTRASPPSCNTPPGWRAASRSTPPNCTPSRSSLGAAPSTASPPAQATN